jgi:HKD family nuclease/superfamily II DNA or RNA helicase
MLDSANAADIAVGYFFVSGFNAVAPQITRLDKVRLLVGRTDRATLEEVAAAVQQAEALTARLAGEATVRRSKKAEVAARSVDEVAKGVAGMSQTKDSECDVKALRDFIGSGHLEIRTYPKARLHAKAYLCWYPGHAEPGAAIVGSSNFTLAGFTGNTELNVRVTGDAEMAELKRWFDELWDDSVDITDDIAVELDRSWALAETPPYHVYLKALYEIYKDQLLTPEIEPRPRGGPELADFQLDAVARGLRMIDLYGGCFIGDVVGLGKTYIGAELLRQLAYTERGKPLIICPAGLIPMWERISELFNLGAEVISMSNIAPPPGLAFDEEDEAYYEEPIRGRGINLEEEYPNRGPVLVDEAHNFRNNDTRRYRAISHYLASGEHKVVLLSATPQNLGPKDIYQQLRLFLDDMEHGLNIEPLRLEDYFNAVQHWYDYKLEQENWKQDYTRWQADQKKPGVMRAAPPEAPKAPTLPLATIEEVLNPTFIRRRRKDIKELYGDDVYVSGKKVNFIDPALDNLPYRLDSVYAKAGSFDDLQHRIAQHQGARYLAVDYILPAKRNDPAYRDLLRARNRVAALMRHLLFKRLESSVAAFRSTLETLIRSNRNFRASLDEGFVPIGKTATRLLSGEAFDPEDLMAILASEEEKRLEAGAKRAKLVHPVSDFRVDDWKAALDADFDVLEDVRKRIEPITPEDDDKLQALKVFLAQPDVAENKLIIFSEAETTIDYLQEQLSPGGVNDSIAVASGSTRDSLQTIVKRFSPKSNLKEKEKMPGPPVRVLLATDIVSEGQNLQDANRVLNYDLHWNPVRLIQRFGRVDRIGTEHTDIYLHNMWPDLAVDAELDLTERLLKRIQAFHYFIGLDSQLLSNTEQLNPNAMYRIYAEKKLAEDDDVLDEVASFQRGINLLQKLEKDDPELWETIINLPDGIRSALKARKVEAVDDADRSRFIQAALHMDAAQLPLAGPEVDAAVDRSFAQPGDGETVVLLKTGETTGSFAVDSDLNPRPVTPGQLISAIECGPDEPRRPLPEDTNERVTAAFKQFKFTAESRLGKARRPGTDTRLRRYLSKHLNLYREEQKENPEEIQRASILQRIFLDHLPGNVINEVAEVRKMHLEGIGLVRRLEALRTHFKLNPPDPDEEAEPADAVDVIRTICSDGLVG